MLFHGPLLKTKTRRNEVTAAGHSKWQCWLDSSACIHLLTLTRRLSSLRYIAFQFRPIGLIHKARIKLHILRFKSVFSDTMNVHSRCHYTREQEAAKIWFRSFNRCNKILLCRASIRVFVEILVADSFWMEDFCQVLLNDRNKRRKSHCWWKIVKIVKIFLRNFQLFLSMQLKSMKSKKLNKTTTTTKHI